MKYYILCMLILFSAVVSYAQKQDSLPAAKTNTRIAPAKIANPKLVNQKLVQIQATIKKLETILKEAIAERDKLKDQKDSLSELNQEDMLQLQQLMEKTSQLEQMISNVMKAAAEVQNSITKNLKAS
jgi:hypothetical protein